MAYQRGCGSFWRCQTGNWIIGRCIRDTVYSDLHCCVPVVKEYPYISN
ncbi:chitin-binding domain-containing protein [Pluralibacter gergoviae]